MPQQYSHGPVLYNANGTIQTTTPSALPTTLPTNSPQVGLSPVIVTHTLQTPQKVPSPLVPYGPTPPKPLNRPSFIVPPADIQIIIDKMASYVAKNGRDFEAIVKNKGDPRFNFLELSHQYHGYYAHKLTIYEGDVNPHVLTEEELLQKQELQEEKQKKLEELQKKQQRMEEVQKRVKMIQEKKKVESNSRESPSKQITTVSFSIKKPKEGESSVIEKRNALPLEESDDDDGNEKREKNSKPNSPVANEEDVNNTKMDKELVRQERKSSKPLKVEKDTISSDKSSTKERKPTKTSSTKQTSIKASHSKPNVKGLSTKNSPVKTSRVKMPSTKSNDIVDLTEDIFEDCPKESINKETEKKNKGKKIEAAKEKSSVTKEKQLQMERRKKAMMFLSQIQAPTIVKPETSPLTTLKEESMIPPNSSATSLDIEIEEIRMCTNSLMSRLRGSDLDNKRLRQRSRSPSVSDNYSERQKSHKKHKKRKSSHKRLVSYF